jgi:hypothetical protein
MSHLSLQNRESIFCSSFFEVRGMVSGEELMEIAVGWTRNGYVPRGSPKHEFFGFPDEQKALAYPEVSEVVNIAQCHENLHEEHLRFQLIGFGGQSGLPCQL